MCFWVHVNKGLIKGSSIRLSEKSFVLFIQCPLDFVARSAVSWSCFAASHFLHRNSWGRLVASLSFNVQWKKGLTDWARETPGRDLERFPCEWKYRFSRWETKWNWPFHWKKFHWKFFGKKGIPSELFLFSLFHRNYRKITVPFTLSH